MVAACIHSHVLSCVPDPTQCHAADVCRYDEYGQIALANPPRSLVGRAVYRVGALAVDGLAVLDRKLEELKVGAIPSYSPRSRLRLVHAAR